MTTITTRRTIEVRLPRPARPADRPLARPAVCVVGLSTAGVEVVYGPLDRAAAADYIALQHQWRPWFDFRIVNGTRADAYARLDAMKRVRRAELAEDRDHAQSEWDLRIYNGVES